jgi:hypothetical protein
LCNKPWVKNVKVVPILSLKQKEWKTMKRILVADAEEHGGQLYLEELSGEGSEILTLATGHNLIENDHSASHGVGPLPVDNRNVWDQCHFFLKHMPQRKELYVNIH